MFRDSPKDGALQTSEPTVAGNKPTTTREGKTGRASQEALPILTPIADSKVSEDRRLLTTFGILFTIKGFDATRIKNTLPKNLEIHLPMVFASISSISIFAIFYLVK